MKKTEELRLKLFLEMVGKKNLFSKEAFISDVIGLKNALSQLEEKKRSPWGIVSPQILEKLIADAQAVSEQKANPFLPFLDKMDEIGRHVLNICETVVTNEFLHTLKEDAQTREEWSALMAACEPFLTLKTLKFYEQWESYIEWCQMRDEINTAKKAADEAQVPKRTVDEIQASKKAVDELKRLNERVKQRALGEMTRIESERKVEHRHAQSIFEEQINQAQKQADDSKAKRVQEIKAKQALSVVKKSSTNYSALLNLIVGISICSVVIALACLNVLSIGLVVGAVLFTAAVCAGVHFFTNRQKGSRSQQQMDNTLSHATI